MDTIKRKKKKKHKIFLSLAVIFLCLGMISLPNQTVSADIPEELIEFGEKYPEGKIMVNDPNSNINSEKHWPMEEILPQIRNIWKYTKVSL